MAAYQERVVIGDCTLYRGDAYEILPTLTGIQSILTDPPWEIGPTPVRFPILTRTMKRRMTLTQGQLGWWSSDIIPLCETACQGDILIFAGFKELGAAIQACQYYRCTFVWRKSNAALQVAFPAKLDTAFVVWTAKVSRLYGHQHWPSMVFDIPKLAAGAAATERLIDHAGNALHPAQAPVRLYAMLLDPLPRGVICDPFLGTGTTALACIQLGHTCIGIEREPRYFDMACRRIEQAYAQPALFPVVAPRPRQQALFSAKVV